MNKWKVGIPVLVIALFFLAWYAFRPERLAVDRRVHEELTTTGGRSSVQTLASGTFHGVLHPTQGTATIYRYGDGSRVLRFTNFKTSNGPDVHVYMVAADDAKDSTSVQRAEVIDLGTIKGNIGDQNYHAPTTPAPDSLATQIDCCRPIRFTQGLLSHRELLGSVPPGQRS